MWNGVSPFPLESVAPPITEVELETNVGVPAGRNLGAGRTSSNILLFLDDDATLTPGVTSAVSALFEADERLGVVALRIRDPETGITERRWVPRLGKEPDRPGKVTRFPGGACAIRAEVFDMLGGFRGDFFFGHEESEFALRVIDAGYQIEYRPELVVLHPAGTARRSSEYTRFLGRNRVWLAKLRLPWPVAIANIIVWLFISSLRSRSFDELGAYWQGWLAGIRQNPGGREPVSWHTVWTMTRLGQPPIL